MRRCASRSGANKTVLYAFSALAGDGVLHGLYGYLAAALLACVAVAARWCARRTAALLLASAAAALALASLRYPADGVFPVAGPVFDAAGGFGRTLAALRDGLGARIDALFPHNGGMAKGMLLGVRSDMAEGLLDSFQQVGVMHLLAISGLHVSVLAGAVALLFRRGAWARFLAVAVFLLIYAALTAFSPSVVRAGVMLLCYELAFPLMRRPDRVTALATAFLLILLCNPAALFYTGFQLSFAAVYGLILLAPGIARPMARLGEAASGLIAGSLAVTIATLPAMAAAFGRVQLSSLLTNLHVLPLVPAFLVPAFAGTALSYLAYPVGRAVCAFADLVLGVIASVASAGGGIDVALKAPNAAAYLLFLFALPFFSPLCLLDRYKKLLCGVVLIAASLVCWVVG